jgi:hypothetical protein
MSSSLADHRSKEIKTRGNDMTPPSRRQDYDFVNYRKERRLQDGGVSRLKKDYKHVKGHEGI